MSEQVLVNNCSPTFAGIKTGNLFNCKYSDKQSLIDEISSFNRAERKKGVRMIPLLFKNDCALIYVYRPKMLERDLSLADASGILSTCGYNDKCPDKCIIRLIDRLKTSLTFPHEIGLFLGYPAEDVKGFIDNKAANYKFVGCWKVYGDEEIARKTFAKYKACTNYYKKRLTECGDLDKLIVGSD